jgi:hypothetical protein
VCETEREGARARELERASQSERARVRERPRARESARESERKKVSSLVCSQHMQLQCPHNPSLLLTACHRDIFAPWYFCAENIVSLCQKKIWYHAPKISQISYSKQKFHSYLLVMHYLRCQCAMSCLLAVFVCVYVPVCVRACVPVCVWVCVCGADCADSGWSFVGVRCAH